jgi:hypothetical protein
VKCQAVFINNNMKLEVQVAARRVLPHFIKNNALGLLTFEKEPFGNKTIFFGSANRLIPLKAGDKR